MAKEMVSYATLRNWQKLSVVSFDEKLNSRANKVMSGKTFIPREYFSNIDNMATAIFIVESIKAKKVSIDCAINSLCLAYLHQNGIVSSASAKFILEFKKTYCEEIANFILPKDEKDFIGIIYQCLQTEGEKNIKGSYFTPQQITDCMAKNLMFAENQKVLDPCCGSGGFLLAYNHTNPKNIFGYDIDKTAVKIAITNLIVKYKHIDFMPNIVCGDFLLTQTQTKKFDYIITNSPWGTKYQNDYSKHFPQIKSKELFSYFIVKSAQCLKPNGQMRFLLPEAMLHVKTHGDCRKFVLDNFSVSTIKLWGRCFSGVQSNVISLQLSKPNKQTDTLIETDKEKYFVPQETFSKNADCVFTISNTAELELLKKIYTLPYQTLEKSLWGLGIVTGNNQERLSAKQDTAHPMPILTGKEINKYVCSVPKNFFNFDRVNLQQVAKDEIYLAKEKLLYKFISNKLVFAFDDKQSFVLNSANVLIPQIAGMSIKSVMAFLNSKIMQFAYAKSFNQLKVIKSNLCKLPFPYITSKFNDLLTNLVDNEQYERIDDELYKFYDLTTDEILLIEKGEIK
jgi:hypothetical protein